MYLSKIELFGFKSFANRVKISFDKGLTAIVGPNGCGKTNVVDAIRWVLGEQKSSLLRSAKMENIISTAHETSSLSASPRSPSPLKTHATSSPLNTRRSPSPEESTGTAKATFCSTRFPAA